MGVSQRKSPGHLDIEQMWFMNAAGNWPGRKIDSNSGDEISKFFKLLFGVKVKKDILRHILSIDILSL